jgi:hypothetical protein
MTTSKIQDFQSVDVAGREFVRCLGKGQEWLNKSHPAACYAMHVALEDQDLAPLSTFRALVKDNMPRYVRAFDAWVTAMLDGVRKVGEAYDDGGESFTLSQCANWGVAWCVAKPLANEGNTTSKAPIDPRATLKQMANKLAERGCKDVFAAHISRKSAQDKVREVLARAMADIEAIHAGTYGKAGEQVEQAKPGKLRSVA